MAVKRTKGTPTTRTKPEAQSRRTYLTNQLRQAHADLDAARHDHSWQAVAALRRQAVGLRDDLDMLIAGEAAAASQIERLSDDELVGELRAALAVLPVSVVEEIMLACEDRVGPARLELVK